MIPIDDVAGGLLVYYDFVVVHRQLFLVFICRFGKYAYICSGKTNKYVYEHKWFECHIACQRTVLVGA